MFERFTDRARRVVVLAQEEARLLNHNYIGTEHLLLGLVREGRLLSHDHDMDVGMWVEEADRLVALRPELLEEGVRLTTLSIDGALYKVKLRPVDSSNGSMPVTIHAFRQSGDYAWAYQFHVCRMPPEPPTPGVNYRSFGMWLYRNLIRRSGKLEGRIRRRISIRSRARWWPFSAWNRIYTWCIPARFFESTITDQNTSLMVPAEYEEYLAFRYGDWRVPNKDWYYYRDDRTLLHKPPAEVLRIIAEGKTPW
jgi:hypothetical protein